MKDFLFRRLTARRSITSSLAIVAGFLPLAHALRATWGYRWLVFAGGSVAIAAVASVWLVERAFEVSAFAAIAAR